MPDTSTSRVLLMYQLLLADLTHVCTYSWSSIVLAFLYRVLDHEIDYH